MRCSAALVAVLCAACYHPTVPAGAPCTDDDHCPTGQSCIGGFCGGVDQQIDGGRDTAPLVDAPPDAPLCQSFNAHYFDPCAIPPPGGDLLLASTQAAYNWDTTGSGSLKGNNNVVVPVTTMVLTQTGGPPVLLASVKSFTLATGATLNVFGTKPLLLVVWGTATVGGFIDLSGDFGTPGPGGNSPSCVTSTGPDGSAGPPPSGGVGGGFHGTGGRGGNIAGTNGSNVGVPTAIRGGCAGGSGGNGGGGAATRGSGGGAIQIAALDTINITGTIHAGGGGGAGGTIPTGGGAGGGAGGYIGLEARTVNLTGTLAANGGAGGGGASDVAAGGTGADGRPSNAVATGGTPAATSNIGACTGGGNGSLGPSLNGLNGSSSACGGGGGGGASGYILIWSPMTNNAGIVMPPITPGP